MLEKNFFLRLIKKITNLKFKKVNLLSFKIEYKRPDCSKQVIANMLQSIGGISDNFQENTSTIQKIYLKNLNSFRISVFYPFFF